LRQRRRVLYDEVTGSAVVLGREGCGGASSQDTRVLEYPIEDLVEMKKHGVWIGRTVLGWAASINLEGIENESVSPELSSSCGLSPSPIPP
jgi:hypothetical protein